MQKELRTFDIADLRVETREDGKRRIIGHAAVFNSLSEDLGGFREMIAPGAFADSIGKDDVRALFNHDTNLVLGRNKSGTLRLSEDEQGLRTEIDLPDTQLAADLSELMARGDISQMSFGFTVRKDDQDWEKKGDGVWMRTIRKVTRLLDVSVVTFPAYPQTDAAVRMLGEIQAASERDMSAAQAARNLVLRVQQQRARMLTVF